MTLPLAPPDDFAPVLTQRVVRRVTVLAWAETFKLGGKPVKFEAASQEGNAAELRRLAWSITRALVEDPAAPWLAAYRADRHKQARPINKPEVVLTAPQNGA